MKSNLLCGVGLMVTLFAFATPVFANSNVVEPGKGAKCGDPGYINEVSPVPADFIINLTGKHGQVVGSLGKFHGKKAADGNYRVNNVYFPGSPGVCDAINETLLLADLPGGNGNGGGGHLAKAGAGSHLYIESLAINPETGEVEVEGIFGRLIAELGYGVIVPVPDLYADTNTDGEIGEGDLLYSLVDLRQYIRQQPTFSLGNQFSIIDGKTDALPGMIFSSTPFVFDPQNFDIGFTGTPFTGTAVALTAHELGTSVPESSSTLGLLAIGTLGLVSALNRKLNRSKSTEKETEKVF